MRFFAYAQNDRISHVEYEVGAKALRRSSRNILIGSDTNNLSRIENGKKFLSAEKLSKIASALNVEVQELFDFGHILSDDELKKEIILLVDSLSTKQLKYLYKSLKNLKEL